MGRDAEQQRRERALARRAREFRDLAEQASDVVSRSDHEGVYTYVSPVSERVYERTPDEMLGRSVFEFMHPDDHDAHRALRAALADGAHCIVRALEQEFIERPALLEGQAVTARASIGVAELDAELDVDGVLRRADQAMYAVKRSRS